MDYFNPPRNYISTALFLTYILAALYATFSITYSLYSQYNTIILGSNKPTENENLQRARSARARHIQIYAFLASISFATLSYNMLMFLINHYLTWSDPSDPSLFRLSDLSVERLKNWMMDSSLFQDFAVDLVKDAPNAVWTQAALLGTWFWGIWIAQKARRRRFDASKMRNFILLSQILPISFTAALFLIQLHLSSPDIQDPESLSLSADGQIAKQAKIKPKASLQLPNILLNASLLALPSLRSHKVFGALILFERAILLLPHSKLLSLRDEEVVKCITVSGGFLMANVAMLRKDLNLWNVLGALGDGGFAVKALAWDMLLGGLVAVVLSWGGGV